MLVSSPLKRVLTSWLIVAFLASQLLTFDMSYGKPVIEEYGIVAILVDSSVYNDTTSYDGLRDDYGSYLSGDDTLPERIDRYAYDVQSTLGMTKSIIIQVQPDDTPADISYALERLYFDGDGTKNEKNHLVGVVVVGDVPLPVVTKGGNKFLSMLPYTDFEDKIYIFNQDTGDFERNSAAEELAPEAWHGVIVPPSDDVDTAHGQLAEFFDKNHLYHLGVADYADFDQKLFYGDMIAEEKAVSENGYASYDRFTQYWEEIAYSRYNKHLAEDLYIEVTGEIFADGKDNDGDGLIDEDPEDGIDNDGDGFIDEDFGDPYVNIDNDQDGSTDEDGTEDNDADNDGRMDEDPPGDDNGDGCPGTCGVDDDNDSRDTDDDGWPTGLEVLVGWDPDKKSSPFLFHLRDEDLQEEFANMFIDEDPFYCPEGYQCWDDISKHDYEGNFQSEYIEYDSRCFDESGDFHPEWDDDEDGYCDEDTEEDNDADGDGQIDEDRGGDEDQETAFEVLPDVQAKNLFEQFTNRYYELFEKLIAQSQDWTDFTGRYSASYTNEDGGTSSDLDSPMALIGKKDEFTLTYLRAVNDLLEGQVDDVVDTLQQDVYFVANVGVDIMINFEPPEGEDTGPSIVGNPTYFINHSVSGRLKPFDIMIYGQRVTEIDSVEDCSAYLGTYDEEERGSQLVAGLRVYDLDTVGKYKKEGKDYGGCFGNYFDMSYYGSYVDSLTFCFPEIASEPVKSNKGTMEVDPGEGDASLTPDYRACNDLKEVRWFLGDGLLTDFITDSSLLDSMSHLWEQDAKGYYYYAEEFSKELNKIFEDDHDDGDDLDGDNDYDEDDLAVEIEELVDELNDKGAYETAYRDLDDIDLFDNDYLYEELSDYYDEDDMPEINGNITLADVLESIGYDPDSQDDLTAFLLGDDDYFTIDIDDDVIDSIDVSVTKFYVPDTEDSAWFDLPFEDAFVTTEAEAYKISSVYEHKQPANEVITEQVEAQWSRSLPIDDPRHVSFQDQNYEFQDLYYANVFDADDVADFQNKLEDLGQDIASVPGGNAYTDTVLEFFDGSVDQAKLEDALAWMHMNIDEKHEYILSHYLGSETAYISDPSSGYEVVYLVGDGDQQGYNFAFNGYGKANDEDLELANPDMNYDPGAAGGSGDGESDFEPEPVFTWIEMILAWIDSLSAIGTSISIETACSGVDYCDGALDGTDSDDNGVPDNADNSAYIRASIPDGSKLYTNGISTVPVTVEILDEYGEVNTADSFTQVQLNVISGDNYGQVSSQNPALVVNGVAKFDVMATTDPGELYVQAVSVNNDMNNSDYVHIESTLTHLKLYTYDLETLSEDYTYTVTELEDLVLMNEAGDILATVNVSSGAIDLLDSGLSLSVVSAVADEPTRISFDYYGVSIAYLYVVPDTQSISIIDGERSLSDLVGVTGVELLDLDETDDYFLQFEQGDESEVILWYEVDQILASAKSNGQIFTRDDLGVSIKLIENNFESGFYLAVNDVAVARIKIGSGDDSGRNSTIVGSALGKRILATDDAGGLFSINKAYASQSQQDTDGDGINDLYEYAIGTDYNLPDTDSDSYSDWDELQNGYDPLSTIGAPLFSDVNTSHEAYYDILELYMRGVLTSYSDGSFRPDQAIKREEFPGLMLGGICFYCDKYSDETKDTVEGEYSTDPFPDTDISEEYYYCVADAKNLGLVAGYKGGVSFGYYLPQNNISVAEAVRVMTEAAALLDSSYETAEYTGSGPWYYNYVLTAQSLGMFPEDYFLEVDHYSGDRFKEWFDSEIANNGTFIAWLSKDITRAEFAMMVVNVIEIYDCRLDDSDGDGISDNEELLVYNTDPLDEDTDDGGVTDFAEIVSGTDPLDASDDGESDYEIITTETSDDEDGDGLLTADEHQIGTLSYDPDTDDGGVWDGMEMLYGTNSIDDPSDDYFSFDSDGGVYAEGSLWQRDYVYSSTDYVETIVTENIVYIGEMPADGSSALKLRAEVINEYGLIDSSDNSSVVEFIILDPGNDYAEIDRQYVSVSGGVAETEVVATTTSGSVQVTAEITPNYYPVSDVDVNVYPGAPASLEFLTPSTIMAAGGLNKMDGVLMLYDQYGNIAYNDPYTVTLDIDGGGTLSGLFDEDATTDGIQITTFEGYIAFAVTSSVEEGTTILSATASDITTSLDIDVMTGINLVVEAAETSVTADGVSESTFEVYAADANGDLLSGFNPEVTLGVLDDTYGSISSIAQIQLISGHGEGAFVSSTVSGDAYIMASTLGIEPGSAIITTTPGNVHELRLETGDGSDLIMTGETKQILVKGYDQYGNFAYNDSSTSVSLRLTDSSEDYGHIGRSTTILAAGESSFLIAADDVSGVMNIVASADDLMSGILALNVRKEVDSYDIASIEPNVLYATLLGAPVGQVTYEDYFAGYFLFNGKTEAVASLLDYPDPHKRLMQLDSNGKSTLIEGNFLIQKVLPSTDSLPTTLVWQDDPENLTLADILVILDEAALASSDLSSETDPGVYVQLRSSDELYDLYCDETCSVLQDGNEVLRVSGDGQLILFSMDYTLDTNNGYDYPAIDLFNGGVRIATVMLASDFDQDVQILDRDFDLADYKTLSPGVYMRQHDTSDYGFEVSFSGSSSDNPIGYYLVDSFATLSAEQSPSLGYTSLDSAQDQGGIGFEGDNKNILLFSAGNTAGESNQQAVSEIGVLLGDPTISLDTNESNALGYTKDIGRIILNGDESVQDIVPLDYNNDGLEDLPVAYENGEIKLLQNYDSEERFKDRGDLLNIVSGILSYDHDDFNLDGYEDLIIATKDACIEGEVCIYLYENNEGQFDRINLDMDTGDQVYQILAEDMNNDDYPDIVTSDNVGNIMVFYNDSGEIKEDGYFVGNVGVKVNDDDELGDEIYVYYDGMTENDDEITTDDSYFYTLSIPDEDGFDSLSGSTSDYFAAILDTGVGDLAFSSDDPAIKTEVEFVRGEYDEGLYSISKSGSDINGGVIEPGDEVQYTITIANSAAQDISDLYISDVAPTLLNLDSDSFECLSGCDSGGLEVIETGVTARPYAVHGIDLAAGDTVSITYSMYVLNVPKVNLTIGNDIDDYVSDNYLDIVASPAGNPTGQVMYFHSNGSYIEADSDRGLLTLFSGLRVINYTEAKSEPVSADEVSQNIMDSIFADAGLDGLDLETDLDEDGTPDALQGEDDELPESVEELKNTGGTDADEDGLIDSWDLSSAVAVLADQALSAEASLEVDGGDVSLDLNVELISDDLANAINGVLSSMICGGGCIAVPLNVAFLATGMFNLYGIPAGYDPGFPVFGTLNALPPVCTGFFCDVPISPFRLYFSITTTLGTAMAICVGPYPLGQCWAFNLPILQMTGICDQINMAISSALSDARAAVSIEDTKTMIMNSVHTVTDEDIANGGLESYALDDYQISASFQANVQVPGFPSVITKWLKSQKEEILGLLDLPDIYFIYPDLGSIGGAFSTDAFKETDTSDLNGLTKALTYLNSMPLIQINTETVYFSIPSLSKEEWQKYQSEWQIWVKDAKKEVKDITDDWIDLGFSAELTQVEEFIGSMEANIQVIDEYLELPKEIVKFRQAEITLVKQIVCYLDAIITYTGGYLKVQIERIDAWKKFIKDIKEAFESWSLLFQLSIDYQDSCDQCTTQRGSLIELLMKLFIFIPDIPIIDLPKWPDIVIDVSQIQAGVTISWPDVKFQSDPLILPDIPPLDLPEILIGISGDIDLGLPALPVLPSPPKLPELPELPGLVLVELPDIPPPPKVPELDISIQIGLKILGNVIKIICMVRQGLIPTPENQLKTKIEDITQRPLDVLFPFDMGFSLNLPAISFDFVQRIEIIARMNLSVETDFIVEAVQEVADISNSLSNVVTGTWNDAVNTANDVGEAVGTAAGEADIDVDVDAGFDAGAGTGVDAGVGADLTYNDDDLVDYADNELLAGQFSLLEQVFENLQSDMDEYQETLPEEIPLVATEKYLALSDLRDYETVSADDYNDVYNLIAGTPTESLLGLKEQLIAYVDSNESINSNVADWDSMQRLLVHNSSGNYLLADYVTGGAGWSNEQAIKDGVKNTPSLTSEDLGSLQSGLLASVDEFFADATESDSSSGDAYDLPVPVTEGLFIYNPEEEVNERLINYTAEANRPTKIVAFDMDNDGDDDIVYSYGGVIYLKENYEDEPADLDTYTGVPKLASVDYFLPEIASVNLFKAGEVGNEEASMRFSGDLNEVLTTGSVGYEVRYYEGLTDIDLENDPIMKATLIVGADNETVPFYDENGNEYVFGTEITASDELGVSSAYDDLVVVPEDGSLLFPDVEKGFAYVSDVDKDAILKNSYSRTVAYDNGETTVTGGDVLHALEDSEITIDLGADDDFTLLLTENTIFPIPTHFTVDLDIRVERGGIEIIDKSEANIQEEQTLVTGMLLYEGDTITTSDGAAIVTLLHGGSVEVAEGQSYFYNSLLDFDSPMLTTSLPNGTYYSQVFAIDDDGNYSTTSNTVLLAPQICADDSDPYPDAGSSTKDLAVFATDMLDASGSFDYDSGIIEYYWDIDLDVDSDGDGNTENDADYFHDLDPTTDYDSDGNEANDRDDPYMEIGPYDEVGTYYLRLWVKDEAGNTSSQLITVNVYVPDIFVDAASSETGIVTGHIDPVMENMPLILTRSRDSIITQIITDSADTNGKYYTDADGNYEITDVDLQSKVLILNSAGETVAEFNPDTGQVIIVDDRYAVDILPTDLEWPTRLVIYEIASGTILQSIFLVTDSNTDITMEDSSFEFTAESISDMSGVHVKVVNDWDFEINLIGASDPLFPGSLEIVSGNERAALISSDGNIYLLSDDFDLNLKESTVFEDPLVIEMTYADEQMAEIYIAIDGDIAEMTTSDLGLPDMGSFYDSAQDEAQDTDGGGISDELEISYGLNPLDPADDAEDNDSDGLNNADEVSIGTDPNSIDSDGDGLSDYTEFINDLDPLTAIELPFADLPVDDELFLDIYDMVEKGILTGYDISGLTYFMPENEINRAEFTKIMLAILCITPRDEAYLEPNVFYDILYSEGNLPWYYDETKEAYLRGFIVGYLADVDPASGLTAFRPGSTITRAEVATIMLKALDAEGFINLEVRDLIEGEPWWNPYTEAAQDLTPFLIGDSAGDETYILTAEEAADPNHVVTRYEFVEMSIRALHAYNCYTIDSDGDGLSDWEEENIYGSDPADPDTDHGGVTDGEEASLNTDPLDDSDDDWDDDTLSNNDETNVYGTDPNDPDTDDGGIWDGVEINRGTDPLDASDDYSDLYDTLLVELDEGVYFVTDECLICPCPSAITEGAQMQTGDIIYTAITNTDNTKAYSVSNEYEVQ